MEEKKEFIVSVNGCIIGNIAFENNTITHLPQPTPIIEPIVCKSKREAVGAVNTLRSMESLCTYLSCENGAETMLYYGKNKKIPLGVLVDDWDIYIPDNITVNGKTVYAY